MGKESVSRERENVSRLSGRSNRLSSFLPLTDATRRAFHVHRPAGRWWADRPLSIPANEKGDRSYQSRQTVREESRRVGQVGVMRRAQLTHFQIQYPYQPRELGVAEFNHSVGSRCRALASST